jgi:hypothetical protein
LTKLLGGTIFGSRYDDRSCDNNAGIRNWEWQKKNVKIINLAKPAILRTNALLVKKQSMSRKGYRRDSSTFAARLWL